MKSLLLCPPDVSHSASQVALLIIWHLSTTVTYTEGMLIDLCH